MSAKNISSFSRPLLAVIVLVCLPAVYFCHFSQYVSLEQLRAREVALKAAAMADPWFASALYVLFYVCFTALAMPGSTFVSMAGGMLFGTFWGVLLASLGSAIGSCAAFLIARYLLRNWMMQRFSHFLERVNRGIAKEGDMYLLTMRLVPGFPYFILNSVMGMTSMPLKRFFFASIAGMFPGNLVYVYAGTQIDRIHSVQDIISPEFLLSISGLLLLAALAHFLRREKSK